MLGFLNRNLVLILGAITLIGLSAAVILLVLFESTMGWQFAFMLFLLAMIGAPIVFSVSRVYRHR